MLQAAGTLGFFGASTFIPDYLHATGRPDLIATALAALGLGQLPGSLVVGFLPRHTREAAAVSIGCSMLLALVALLVAPGVVFVLAAGALGMAAGATLVMALSLPPLIAAAADVPRVAAGVQAIGYGVVWIVLLAAGAAWDTVHNPATAFVPTALAGLFVLVHRVNFREPSLKGMRASIGAHA